MLMVLASQLGTAGTAVGAVCQGNPVRALTTSATTPTVTEATARETPDPGTTDTRPTRADAQLPAICGMQALPATTAGTGIDTSTRVVPQVPTKDDPVTSAAPSPPYHPPRPS